jgi:CheY-like chemotaxis protein
MGIATRVLVADDDADSRAITRTFLEFQGREVLEAVDGRTCVITALVHRPDVIVLDLIMPNVDGWQATAMLRADPATRAIPILALTATSQPDDRDRALAAGCDRVLFKPIALSELTAVIDALHQVAQTAACARAEHRVPGVA